MSIASLILKMQKKEVFTICKIFSIIPFAIPINYMQTDSFLLRNVKIINHPFIFIVLFLYSNIYILEHLK